MNTPTKRRRATLFHPMIGRRICKRQFNLIDGVVVPTVGRCGTVTRVDGICLSVNWDDGTEGICITGYDILPKKRAKK